MNIYTSETEYLKTEVQRLRALVRAQQITIEKLEAQPEQKPVKWSDHEPDGMHHNKPEQEPVAWMHVQGNHEEPSLFRLDDDEIERGWEQYPLYTTPPAQRTWVLLTNKEIDQGLLRTNYAFKTAEAWRDGVEWAMTQLKEKNAP